MALTFEQPTGAAARAPARDRAPRTARRRAGLGLLAGVLLAHAALLALWPAAPGPGAHGDASRPLQVRQITRPLAAPDAQLTVAAGAAQATTVPPALRPARSRPADGEGASPAAAASPAISPAVSTSAAQAVVQSNEPEPAPGGAAVPIYPTRLPPSTTLRYALRRSGVPGHAELQWFNDGAQYRLSLRNEAPGALSLGSASTGAIDAHGLAPERHTDSRRGRDVRAVNFQRDSARVTFSGSKGEVPLVAGAQDRLSWMLQLAGIAEANPALRAAGSEISVFVVGTRGDAEVWLFTVVDAETIELPAGSVPGALHLRREPHRLYDTTVDIWLDPTRQHLPVRAELRVRPTGLETVLLLESASAP
jgi:hypothetical protein